MNLGITRAVIGDIIVEEKKTYIFCAENMAEMIEKELVRIKHTTCIPVNPHYDITRKSAAKPHKYWKNRV